jgi:[ribosomal protein S5]-alanine N-acetyltransferase
VISVKIEDIFGDLPKLETERTIIRKLNIEDLNDMYIYCSDVAVSEYTTWDTHKSLDDTKGFIDFILKAYSNNEVAPWGIEDKNTNKLIGTCGFVYWNITHSRAELGYALSRNFWKKGIMSEVVRRIIDFGFKEMNLVRIEARCHPNNIGSAKVMEKSEMILEGILRKHLFAKDQYQDVKMYSIIKDKV